MTTQTVVPEELQNFVKDFDDYYARRLIFFFAEYPNARFDSKAIFGALGEKDNRPDMNRALDKLVEHKITDVSTDSPFPVYRLGEDIITRSQVMELGRLDFNQKQELLNLTHSS